jgi:hypothetical protein
MQISLQECGTGKVVHIQIHHLIIEHCHERVVQYAIQVMIENNADSVVVTPR